MQRKVGQIIGRWERRRTERAIHRELQAATPGVREDYLEAIRRSA